MASPLPHKHGVGPSRIALPPGCWLSMAAFLIERFPKISPGEWAARMDAGEVCDEHGAAVTWHTRYRPGAHLYYYRSLAAEASVPFEETVLYQDDWIVVADKPHFLPVTPGGQYLQESLLVRLKRKLGIETLAPVHRLDRETAGLVLFTIRPETRGAYQALFRERNVEKRYEAIVTRHARCELPRTHHSRIEQATHFMQMHEVAGAANSETHIELLAAQGEHAHLALFPRSGRKHQLRVHCTALGMPILHDQIYPQLLPHGQDDYTKPLQLLAQALRFCDPLTHEMRSFASPRQLAAAIKKPA